MYTEYIRILQGACSIYSRMAAILVRIFQVARNVLDENSVLTAADAPKFMLCGVNCRFMFSESSNTQTCEQHMCGPLRKHLRQHSVQQASQSDSTDRERERAGGWISLDLLLRSCQRSLAKGTFLDCAWSVLAPVCPRPEAWRGSMRFRSLSVRWAGLAAHLQSRHVVARDQSRGRHLITKDLRLAAECATRLPERCPSVPDSLCTEGDDEED